MLRHYPKTQLGHANHGWLDTRYHFSFSNYYNPKRMGFGALRVINDDVIRAGAGFDMHPHRDMEIITFVRSGAITHRDSHGNHGRTEAGDVQVMSAGTGVFHSEFNLEDEDTTLYQIWIEPNKRGVKPQWAANEFPKTAQVNELKLLVAGDGSAPLRIHQDAEIWGGRLTAGSTIQQPIKRQAYILVSEGEVVIEGTRAQKGDGMEVTQLKSVEMKALKDSEIVLIDVPA